MLLCATFKRRNKLEEVMTNQTIPQLETFDFTLNKFVLEDLLEILLEHIDINDTDHITECIVVLNTENLITETEERDYSTDSYYWAWDIIELTFAGHYMNGKELEPQRIYEIEDGKLHVHFKLLDA